MGWFRRLLGRLDPNEPPTALLAGDRATTRHVDGEPDDWSIKFSVGEHQGVMIGWPGVVDGVEVTRDEVIQGFRRWLDDAPRGVDGVPRRTVQVRVGGRTTTLDFRTDWVAAVTVSRRQT